MAKEKKSKCDRCDCKECPGMDGNPDVRAAHSKVCDVKHY